MPGTRDPRATRRARTRQIAVRRLGAVSLALCLLACVGLSAREKAEMDAFVGTLTYAEAVTRWGVPLSKEERDGYLIVVWKEAHAEHIDVGGRAGRGCGTVTGTMSSCIPSPGSSPGGVTVEHGFERTLVFDPETRLLQTWNYRAW